MTKSPEVRAAANNAYYNLLRLIDALTAERDAAQQQLTEHIRKEHQRSDDLLRAMGVKVTDAPVPDPLSVVKRLIFERDQALKAKRAYLAQLEQEHQGARAKLSTLVTGLRETFNIDHDDDVDWVKIIKSEMKRRLDLWHRFKELSLSSSTLQQKLQSTESQLRTAEDRLRVRLEGTSENKCETCEHERCDSCEHSRAFHQLDGCWYTVESGKGNLVCACDVSNSGLYPRPAGAVQHGTCDASNGEMVRRWSPHKEPGPEVTEVIDNDGDLWVRNGPKWHFHNQDCVEDCRDPEKHHGTNAWDEVVESWGPVTDATPRKKE